MNKPIYLDYNATTPLDPMAFEAMRPYFLEEFGNSVSAAHAYGWNAEKAVEQARHQVAKLLNCKPNEIFFTSGATESNNWVIRGLIDRLRRQQPEQKIEIISSAIEHSSVTKALKYAESLGAKIHFIEVNAKGELNLEHLRSLINENTKLMSLMWVNNEIGTINPMEDLAEIAKQNRIYLHSDATQAIGKLKVDLEKTKIDLLSCSAHKIYGPKGIGALYIRSQNPKVELDPLLHGGGHERGQRSGTVNVPSVVGFGKACELISQNLDEETRKLFALQKYFWNKMLSLFPEIQLNGPQLGHRVVNNLSLTFSQSKVPPSFREIAVSRGSACQSGMTSTSPVLKAIGLSPAQAEKTLRLSIGRWSNEAELDQAISILKDTLN